MPLTEEGVPMSTLREISLLKQMEKYEHPNIVRSVLHYSGRYRVLPSFFSSFHFRLSVDVASVSSSELVFTKLNMVFLHYSGRYRVLPSFSWLSVDVVSVSSSELVFTKFPFGTSFLLSLTWFSSITLAVTEFYRVLPSFTEFFWLSVDVVSVSSSSQLMVSFFIALFLKKRLLVGSPL